MTNQYLKSLRSALICAAIVAIVFVPLTSTLAQSSPGGSTLTTVETGDNITRPRLYARTNYEWPFATGPYYGDVVAPVPGTIRTPVGSFHLSQGELPFPTELKTGLRLSELGAQYFLVQAYPEVAKDVHSMITSQGGQVVETRSGGTMVVRLNQAGFAAIENSAAVAGIVPFHAAFKLHPSIGREPLPDPIKATSSTYTLDVLLWEAETAKQVADQMAALGVDVKGIWGDQLLVEADRNLLATIAQIEQVRMIFESLPMFLHAEETTATVQTGQYNGGAIPYSSSGLKGDGAGTLFCGAPDPAYTPCDDNSDCPGSNSCAVPPFRC